VIFYHFCFLQIRRCLVIIRLYYLYLFILWKVIFKNFLGLFTIRRINWQKTQWKKNFAWLLKKYLFLFWVEYTLQKLHKIKIISYYLFIILNFFLNFLIAIYIYILFWIFFYFFLVSFLKIWYNFIFITTLIPFLLFLFFINYI
jgi:hypothetical protein